MVGVVGEAFPVTELLEHCLEQIQHMADLGRFTFHAVVKVNKSNAVVIAMLVLYL